MTLDEIEALLNKRRNPEHHPARRRMVPGDGDPRHGTVNGYDNLKCRCPLCREAWRVGHQEWVVRNDYRTINPNTGERRMSRADYLASLPVPEHGTEARYGKGCKCGPCMTAARAARAARRFSSPNERT
jgi:hypothetical protein